jgi:ABC-2 type transport system permease protein
MTGVRPWSGLARHFTLALQLNLRSGRALAYGYLVPVLFLFGFGGIFRAETPPLAGEMGQLLTITVLGGACFGLPTALVSERERGLWRRLWLLPVSPLLLIVATLLARLLIVASAAALQMAAAHLIFGAPWPAAPLLLLAHFALVCGAFLGLGLLIAALAHDVPAVQALGQCLFLPMILIGGVGVPLAALPEWAQLASGFMPGRYAVQLLQAPFGGPPAGAFAMVALGAIGAAAGLIGAWQFRADRAAPLRRSWLGAAIGVGVWAAVGLVAWRSGHLRPVASAQAWLELTDADLHAIRYDDLPGDNELVTRLAPPFVSGLRPARVEGIAASLRSWPAAQTGQDLEDVRHLLSVAAIADLAADPNEAELARVVFDELERRYRHAVLRKLLAWIVLHPEQGTVVTFAPDLDLQRARPSAALVRERSGFYARKFLGRLTGAIATP